MNNPDKPLISKIFAAALAIGMAGCLGATEPSGPVGGGAAGFDAFASGDALLAEGLSADSSQATDAIAASDVGATDAGDANADTVNDADKDTAVQDTATDAIAVADASKDADATKDTAKVDGSAEVTLDAVADGSCVPTATVEACNNKDDDCDGQTDESDPGLCNDKDPCSADQCISGKCVNLIIPGFCDDGNVCTEDDQCINGQCLPGDNKPCSDGNPCTDNGCDPAKGCVYTPIISGPCEDGDTCTLGEVCTAGLCKGGTAKVCNDKDPCTDDSCAGANGCTFAANTAPCDDGNDCTIGDKCGNSACKPGIGQVCDDKNICTSDTCTAANGCSFANNALACTDNNACTAGDACVLGICKGGVAKVCNDNNPCTTDTCAPITGCTSVTAANGSACPTGTCTAGVCGGKICGNGIVEVGETCDDGDATACGACNATCSGPGSGTALGGNYTIGAAVSATNFATFGEAIASLGKCGVKAATTFTVSGGVYKSVIGFDFPVIVGASQQNLVTFKTAPGALVRLVGVTNTGNYSGVIRLANNASWLTLDGFDIDGTLPENKISGSYGGPINFASGGGQSHITLRNLRIHDFGPTAWTTYTYIGGIYIQQSLTVDSLTIEGCRFENLAPPEVFSTQGAISTRNGKFINLKIIGNRFSGIKGMDAIQLRNTVGIDNLIISNNFIVAEGEGALEFYGTAAFLTAGQFVHNTVILLGTATRAVAGTISGPSLQLRNNIVVSLVNQVPFVVGTAVGPVGFNCLGPKVISGYAPQATDTVGDGKFVNASAPVWDLHLVPGSLCLDKGTPIPTVTTDIDGQTRGIKPDCGADEVP
ncbi:MAG: hypothetical protein EXR77_09765 [Myxococcales bacterium]|nr:hypothetical protein [Myxococcales bacterium]